MKGVNARRGPVQDAGPAPPLWSSGNWNAAGPRGQHLVCVPRLHLAKIKLIFSQATNKSDRSVELLNRVYEFRICNLDRYEGCCVLVQTERKVKLVDELDVRDQISHFGCVKKKHPRMRLAISVVTKACISISQIAWRLFSRWILGERKKKSEERVSENEKTDSVLQKIYVTVGKIIHSRVFEKLLESSFFSVSRTAPRRAPFVSNFRHNERLPDLIFVLI